MKNINYHVELHDLHGKLCRSDVFEGVTTINTEQLNKGVYFIVIRDNKSGFTLVKKIVLY